MIGRSKMHEWKVTRHDPKTGCCYYLSCNYTFSHIAFNYLWISPFFFDLHNLIKIRSLLYLFYNVLQNMYSEVCVTQSVVFIDPFGHCIVCPFSIYPFWLNFLVMLVSDDYEFILFGVIGYICLATAWQTG
jgi:hypothetical protein